MAYPKVLILLNFFIKGCEQMPQQGSIPGTVWIVTIVAAQVRSSAFEGAAPAAAEVAPIEAVAPDEVAASQVR